MNARIEEIQDRAENGSWVSTIRWRDIPWCPVRWLRVGPQVKPAPCQMGNPVSHVHNRVAITQSWLTLKCRSYNCSFLCFFSLDHNMHTHIIPENHPMIHKKWTRRPLVNLLTQGRISGKIQVFIFLCGNVPTLMFRTKWQGMKNLTYVRPFVAALSVPWATGLRTGSTIRVEIHVSNLKEKVDQAN